jgi:hypothetical protein
MNLGFENANTNTSTLEPYPSFGPPQYFRGGGPVKDLLPNWQLSVGGFVNALIGFNSIVGSIGPESGGLVSIFERSALETVSGNFLFNPPPGPRGEYILYFDFMELENYSITQRGDVPASAHLLQINARHLNIFGSITATMDGVEVVNGDISAFAGKNVELKISFDQLDRPFGGDRVAYIDSIEFFPKREPLVFALLPPEGGEPAQLRLSYPVVVGYDYFVDFTDTLLDWRYNQTTLWQTLPGGPHNSGVVLVPLSDTKRFYRFRRSPAR